LKKRSFLWAFVLAKIGLGAYHRVIKNRKKELTLNPKQSMFFRNGRRMVHPKRIHYEQGVLNQAVLFESAENIRPETVYYVSEPFNQSIGLPGTYLHLVLRLSDAAWQTLTSMQQGFSVEEKEKTVVPETPGVYLVFWEVRTSKGEIVGEMELADELIYDSVMVLNSQRPKDQKLFLIKLKEAEPLKLTFVCNDSLGEVEASILIIKISD